MAGYEFKSSLKRHLLLVLKGVDSLHLQKLPALKSFHSVQPEKHLQQIAATLSTKNYLQKTAETSMTGMKSEPQPKKETRHTVHRKLLVKTKTLSNFGMNFKTAN